MILQLHHTYRTRDGSAEHTITHIDGNEALSLLRRSWCTATGRRSQHTEQPGDLVKDVTRDATEPKPQPAGPVRQVTTTRTEIGSGIFGRLYVSPSTREGDRQVDVAIMQRGWGAEGDDRYYAPTTLWSMNADDLDDMAKTATQLADALRAIAIEQQS